MVVKDACVLDTEVDMLPQIHVAGENVYLRASTVNSRNGHNHQWLQAYTKICSNHM